MFIPYVEIKGHHQFSLPEIIKIEAEFTSPTQIIIGTNGAGKTTLLREINPLPAQASDYQPGGYKRVVCLHQNRRYFLESNFGKPVKHIFEVDGVRPHQHRDSMRRSFQRVMSTAFYQTAADEGQISDSVQQH